MAKLKKNVQAGKSAKVFAAELRKKRRVLLAVLAEGWSIQKACESAGIHRATYYEWRKADKEFAAAADAAIEAGTDRLEDEAFRRAYEGTEKPVFYQGMECGRVKEYSDQLAMLLLKGRRPHKFRENVTLTGGDGGPIQVEQIKRVVVDPKNGDTA